MSLAELKVVLKKFIEQENQKYYDERDEELLNEFLEGKLDEEKIVKDTEKLYKEELISFADKSCPSDQEIFQGLFSLYFSPSHINLQIEFQNHSTV